MKNPDISIIIPSYNPQSSLSLCLESLNTQTQAPDFEILVVDSSSHSDVQKICQPFEKVRIIKLKEKTSPGIARNKGAEEAKGSGVVFIDSDVHLKPDALSQIWKHYQQGYKIFGGALELAQESSFPCGWIEQYYFNHESLPRRPLSLRKNLSSALLIVDRKIFLEQGLFKNIPRMQDTELTERMSRQGLKLFFIPAVVGYQIQDATFFVLLRKIFINGNNLYFIRYFSGISIWKRIFFFFALPLITLVKMTRINARNILYSNLGGRIVAFPMIPIMYFCGLFWMAGFYKALISNRGLSQQR